MGEVSSIDALKFGETGLIPAIAFDVRTRQVLMLAYVSRESLQRTLQDKKACYFSRSRQKLWLKGEQSGHYQLVKAVRADCDHDALLFEVEQIGPGACHTGRFSCFFNELAAKELAPGPDDSTAPGKVEGDGSRPERGFNPDSVYGKQENGSEAEGLGSHLDRLYRLIVDRKARPAEGSYASEVLAQDAGSGDSGPGACLQGTAPCVEIAERLRRTADGIAAGLEAGRHPGPGELAEIALSTLILAVAAGVSPGQISAAAAEMDRAGGPGT